MVTCTNITKGYMTVTCPLHNIVTELINYQGRMARTYYHMTRYKRTLVGRMNLLYKLSLQKYSWSHPCKLPVLGILSKYIKFIIHVCYIVCYNLLVKFLTYETQMYHVLRLCSNDTKGSWKREENRKQIEHTINIVYVRGV